MSSRAFALEFLQEPGCPKWCNAVKPTAVWCLACLGRILFTLLYSIHWVEWLKQDHDDWLIKLFVTVHGVMIAHLFRLILYEWMESSPRSFFGLLGKPDQFDCEFVSLTVTVSLGEGRNICPFFCVSISREPNVLSASDVNNSKSTFVLGLLCLWLQLPEQSPFNQQHQHSWSIKWSFK